MQERKDEMTPKEAAAYLGFKSPAWIYKLIHLRRIPYHKRPGKKPRGGGIWLNANELDKWRESGKE